MGGLRLFPEQASTAAAKVDALYLGLVALTLFFGVLIAALLVYFAVRFREGVHRHGEVPAPHPWLEAVWIVIPLGVVLGIFAWGFQVFAYLRRAPEGALEISVVGRQWMWKVQHPEGRREINELHVPVGRPVLLRMISQDVIHSFFIPAFRVKQDVLPGRYTTLWFEATRPGRYHLFCAEYCGTAHSRMTGTVVAMEPARYAEWLAGVPPDQRPAERGRELFNRLGCPQCHRPGDATLGPELEGLFGRRVSLEGGASATADEDYLRESILDPRAKVVEGFDPVMPAFAGRLDEEEVQALVAYLKALGRSGGR